MASLVEIHAGMGIFGVFFLGLLAILIDNNYP